MITKNELREEAKKIRSSLDMKSISEKITESLLSSDLYQAAENIMFFYPLKEEINLLPILDSKISFGKNFYLPKVQGEEMIVCPYKKGDELAVSVFKTQEPLTESVNPDILDLIIVPALMVDKNFHRLGYGKGFYDRFLNKHALRAIRIVPIPSALTVAELPSDEFDAQFDIILDEL